MKLILLTLLLVLAACYSFDEYATKFNKIYSNQEQKAMRENIFQLNMDTYQTINSQFKDYSVGPTVWTDRTDQQIQNFLKISLTGNQQSSQWKRNLKNQKLNFVDWRLGFSEIQNSFGSCASSWAFASTAAFKSKLRLTQGITVNISQEYVVQCAGNSNTCAGGSMLSALELLIKNGGPSSSSYSYVGSNFSGNGVPKTPGICNKGNANFTVLSKKNQVNSFYNIDTNSLTNLIENGTVAASIIADKNFLNYKSGIFSCDYTYVDSLVNHALEIVGYNITGNYFIVKNTWGGDWGMGGYAHVDMNKNCFLTRQVHQIQGPSSLSFIEYLIPAVIGYLLWQYQLVSSLILVFLFMN